MTVIEENPVEREYLTALVGGAPGVALSAAYSNMADALAKLKGKGEQPDLVVVDLDAQHNPSEDWPRQLHNVLPHTPVLVLSGERDRDHLFAVLESGVAGWLQKPCTADQIVRAILVLHEGGAVLSSPVARRILDYFHARGLSVDRLSARERQVLHLLGQGHLAADIAQKLSLSRATVRTHVRNILTKLHTNSRTGALAKYLNPVSGPALDQP